MIRYRYAAAEDGSAVDIEQLDERTRAERSFVCFSCGGAMAARLGEKVARHFAHRSLGECSGETYLHQAGKRLFVEGYAQGVVLSYSVKRVCRRCEGALGAPCVVGEEQQEFDLAARFRSVEEERRDGRLIPDVCLRDERGEKIYVEIAVTHRCDEAKIASGVRIVEFLIESEADLEAVQRRRYELGKEEERVRFYNFRPTLVEAPVRGCERRFWAFTVYASGKYRLAEASGEELSRGAAYCRAYEAQVGLKKAVEDAAAAGCAVRSCFLCAQWDRNRRGVWCRFRKGEVSPYDASQCVYYTDI